MESYMNFSYMFYIVRFKL